MLGIFTIGSIILAIIAPDLGTHIYGKFAGQWRGLLGFKNQAAWSAVLFLILWLGVAKQGWMKRWNLPLIALGLLMLVQTGSATGRGALAFGVTILGVMGLYRRARVMRPYIVILLAMGLVLIAFNFQTLMSWALDSLGRDASLTGRTSVWSTLWPYIQGRLWLGHGYLAFWDDPTDYFGRFGSNSWMITIHHSHNAYVEMLLDVGVLGLVTQLAFLLATCARLFVLVARGDNNALVMLTVLLTLMVIGVAGALFFRPNTGIWIMVVAFACYAGEFNSRHRGTNIQELSSYG